MAVIQPGLLLGLEEGVLEPTDTGLVHHGIELLEAIRIAWRHVAEDREPVGMAGRRFHCQRVRARIPAGWVHHNVVDSSPIHGVSRAGVNFLHAELIDKTRSLVDVLGIEAGEEMERELGELP